jgi:proliferating cell nuclear antigen PCNA
MRLVIDNKPKLEIFVAIFQLLKNWSSNINIVVDTNKLSIQSIDKSHICLVDITITDKWFSIFNCSKNNLFSVDANHFAIIMNYALKHNTLELIYNDENNIDKLFVNLLNGNDNKTTFDHLFEINLIDIVEDSLVIPKVDYDVEFTIEAKKIVETLTNLNTFGQDLNITCTETLVALTSQSDSTKLNVNIPVDDLDEYSITEDSDINVSFSLTHLCKMCLSVKITPVIHIGLSCEYPMLIKYDLGEDTIISFFIAPKITDN